MKQQSRASRQSNSERVEPLSILPVFLDMHGKRAVVIGNDGPAIWKAELLVKAGADVNFICEKPGIEVLQFVSNAGASGTISLSIGDWRNQDLSQSFVIIADIDEADAAELFGRAKKHTSLVNIIDKPAYCTFQFGSIVNKSPLVIGISTSGAAPVLAQHVRSLLEATLPPNIQSLARRAARIRVRVNQRLGESNFRRSYWSAFFGKAFGFKSMSQRSFEKRHVIKVASIDDVTLRDIRALQRAETVYFQCAADAQILQFARREASRIQVKSEIELSQICSDDKNSVLVLNFNSNFK